MPSLLLALWLVACTTTPEVEGPTPQQIARAKAMKAKARRAKMRRAKAKAKTKAGKQVERVGSAGPMVGQMVLTPQGEGDARKTRAQLRMGWEGGHHTAFLGVTAGDCEAVEPGTTASGDQALWWARCSWKDTTADFAILPKGDMVLVQRAISREGEQGEWSTVRRIPLVEGAELTAGEVEIPEEADPAEGAAEGAAEGEAPAEAPEGEATTPAPAPAEGTAPE